MSTYRNENVQNIHQVDDVITPVQSERTAAVPIRGSMVEREVSTEESVGVRGSSVNLESSTLEGMEIRGFLMQMRGVEDSSALGTRIKYIILTRRTESYGHHY